jgi:hypothetical protein
MRRFRNFSGAAQAENGADRLSAATECRYAVSDLTVDADTINRISAAQESSVK